MRLPWALCMNAPGLCVLVACTTCSTTVAQLHHALQPDLRCGLPGQKSAASVDTDHRLNVKILQANCCELCVLPRPAPSLPLPFHATDSELAAVLRQISSGESGRAPLLDGLVARFAAACSGAPVLATLHRLAEAFALACLAYMLDGGDCSAWRMSSLHCTRQ